MWIPKLTPRYEAIAKHHDFWKVSDARGEHRLEGNVAHLAMRQIAFELTRTLNQFDKVGS
jgi:hypothetical protein